MKIFLFILTNNIIPIFVLILFGYFMNKKFDLHIYTLSKLNFYLFVPAFTFVTLYTTQIPLDMLKVLVFAVLFLISNMIISILIAKLRHYDLSLKNAFKNSVMFYNTGNIGIPLITLVFSSVPFVIDGQTPYLNMAITAQIMVLVVQNITTNTLGFINAGQADRHWKDSFLNVLKMPTIYAIPLALIFKLIPYDITTTPIWPAMNYAKNAMISIALIVLGVQLSKATYDFENKEVYLSVFTRLILGPLLALGFIRILGFEGIVAQVLMISSAVPTSVNSALIAVECNNCPDFASQTVMTSTVLSSITLVAVIYTARILFPIM